MFIHFNSLLSKISLAQEMSFIGSLQPEISASKVNHSCSIRHRNPKISNFVPLNFVPLNRVTKI